MTSEGKISGKNENNEGWNTHGFDRFVGVQTDPNGHKKYVVKNLRKGTICEFEAEDTSFRVMSRIIFIMAKVGRSILFDRALGREPVNYKKVDGTDESLEELRGKKFGRYPGEGRIDFDDPRTYEVGYVKTGGNTYTPFDKDKLELLHREYLSLEEALDIADPFESQDSLGGGRGR